jgi:FkbM family methyltransferase
VWLIIGELLMNKIVKEVLKSFLDESNKIKIPEELDRVLLDIGTSYNAPHCQVWTEETKDVCVFGFEPNPFNIKCIKSGKWLNSIWQHPLQLNPNQIGKKVFLVETALSDCNPTHMDFYCAKEDPGTSSLYKPTYIEVESKVQVPVIRLRDFFDLFPWEQVPFIEHIKIDAQSSDFNIVKGMDDYIKKVLYLTVECNTIDHNNTNQYENSDEDSTEMKKYIESCGFECKRWSVNGVFYNSNMKDLWDEYEYYFLEDN